MVSKISVVVLLASTTTTSNSKGIVQILLHQVVEVVVAHKISLNQRFVLGYKEHCVMKLRGLLKLQYSYSG